jgi:hypothetical protein
MPRPAPDFADDLDATLTEAFRLLGRGAADRRHVFHTPTLATVDRHGIPDLRTVVLRGFAPATREMRFHTDARAEKLNHIRIQPRVAVHAYDPGAAIQLRIYGLASLHVGDDLARSAWQQSQRMGRMIYAIQPAPGSEIAHPVTAPDDPDIGETNFAVLTLAIQRLEFLSLHSSGHRRAKFVWDDESAAYRAAWLVP